MDHECGHVDGPHYDSRALERMLQVPPRTHEVQVLPVFVIVLALSSPLGGARFTGVISDDMCANADHSRMRMGSTDAECAIACVSSHGGSYVLHDGRQTYTLTGTQALEEFAGRKVDVLGELDARTLAIKVESITLAK